MISGNGSLSLRKQDLENQKIPAVGFVKTAFAHAASTGSTGINLGSLTLPSSMSSNGFVNPPSSQLLGAQLLFYKNNLTLISSVRGAMQQGLNYTIASSSQINFVGFTSSAGEIFTGIIDYTSQTGIKVVDARPINATGTLTAGATDFNVGTPFKIGQYSTSQIGGVLVFLDGVVQFRNTGNSSSTLDGNYYEVDAGGGLGTVIRFNVTDPFNDRSVLVVSNGLLSERPDGSMMATIESVQGQVNNMASYVSVLAGQPVSTILGAAPSNVDLKAFGDRVFSLESNRARIDLSNTWTAAQPLIGVTDGSSAASGKIGQTLTQSRLRSAGLTLTTATAANVLATPLTLTAGEWDITGAIGFQPANTTTFTNLVGAISKTTATLPAADTYGVPTAGEYTATFSAGTVTSNGNDIVLHFPPVRVSITTSTPYYLVAFASFAVSTNKAYGSLTATRVR